MNVKLMLMRVKAFGMAMLGPKHTSQTSPLHLAWIRVSASIDAGDRAAAIAVLLSVRQHVRRDLTASNLLAYLLFETDRPVEAVRWFRAALLLDPTNEQALMGLAMAQHEGGLHGDMLATCERLVTLRPQSVEAHYHHALALDSLVHPAEALAALETALQLSPDYALALSLQSQVLEKLGRWQEALECSQKLCVVEPENAAAWAELARRLQVRGKLSEAILAYDAALTCDPGVIAVLQNKAAALQDLGRLDDALSCCEAARKIEPDNRQVNLVRANILLAIGQRGEAISVFERLSRGGPVRTYPAQLSGAQPKVCLLFCPLVGNTPYEDLISDGRYDVDTVLFMPDMVDFDVAPLGAANAIINLISDADLGHDVICRARDALSGLDIPILNDPARMLATDRVSISRRLHHLEGLIMPKTRVVPSTAMLDAAELSYPVIVRSIGTHGGEEMDLLAGMADFTEFRARKKADIYVTDFVPYASADGFYRKYRFFFVGSDIYPYHLAIGDHWKVHHASTRMREFEWMRNEEKAFLEDPGSAVSQRAMRALEAVRNEIDLDFFGIDCALTAEGELVVFEVNATMLMHLHADEGFDYKTPFTTRIQKAFGNLVLSKATSTVVHPQGIRKKGQIR